MAGDGIIAARIQRMAADDAFHREPAAAQQTMCLQRADGVMRTTRIETAARPEQRTDQDLVDADGEDGTGDEAGTEEAAMRVHSRSRLSRNCGAVSVRLPGLARITRSTAGRLR